MEGASQSASSGRPTKSTNITTDEKGQARIDLTKEFEGVANTHAGYTLSALFEPAKGDAALAACRSDEIDAYAITTTKQELGWK